MKKDLNIINFKNIPSLIKKNDNTPSFNKHEKVVKLNLNALSTTSKKLLNYQNKPKTNEKILEHKNKSNSILILTHGAGKSCNSLWFNSFIKELHYNNINHICFNFPFAQKMDDEKKKQPPNKIEILINHFHDVINYIKKTYQPKNIFIGGKSMGGRIASMIADNNKNVSGVICYGYPFITKSKKDRTKHLKKIEKKCIILQGERDSFGKYEFCQNLILSKNVTIQYIPYADHDFKPTKKSGLKLLDNLKLAAKLTSEFINEQK